MTAAPPPLAPREHEAHDHQGSVLRAAALRFTVLRAKIRAAVWTESSAYIAASLLVYSALTFAADRTLRLETPVRAVLLLVFAAVVARMVWQRLLVPLRVRLGDDELALAVERQTPDLRQSLISSMQFERALHGERGVTESRELMRAVVDDVETRVAAMPFAGALDARRMARATSSLMGIGLVFVLWAIAAGPSLQLWAMRNLLLSSVEWPRYTQLQFADLGDGVRRLPQGDPLTIVVRATGELPEQVHLRSTFASGESAFEPMSRTGEGEFTLTMETLLENATIVAEGGDGISPPLRIEIVERPRIENVAVQIVFPAYMQKEPEDVPATEGELRIVRGSELRLRGQSHKKLASAFALLVDTKVPLQLEADSTSFAGVVAPEASGLLAIDVIDTDQLGAASPPRLFVRLVEDKPPSVEWKLRGIGPLVTAQVRIPGELKCKDDFGLVKVVAEFRAAVDAPEAKAPVASESAAPAEPLTAPTPPPEVPFVPIDVALGDALEVGNVRYETNGIVDILQRNPKSQDEDDPSNQVRPGMLLALRFCATDNFGPGEPHLSKGEAFTFRVVTREKLVDELRRRQVEQRLEVEKIRDDESAALLALRETLNPKSDDSRASQARLQFKQLAARQQALGRRTAFAADLYQRILWEYENNRIWEPSKVREYEALTSVPLLDLGKTTFPTSAHLVATFADTGDEEARSAAIDGYTEALRRLEAILRVMEQVETLAGLIEQLRGVIKVEDSAIREVENKIKAAGESIFQKPSQPSKPEVLKPPGGQQSNEKK
ncbi:MAG: hypothetical protein ABL997_00595 [Planctomycetota bacterium]